jgi:hypothetical protein
MQVQWNGEFLFALAWLAIVLSIGAISLLNLLIRSGTAVNVASLFYLKLRAVWTCSQIGSHGPLNPGRDCTGTGWGRNMSESNARLG